jgi:hypothetical protein
MSTTLMKQPSESYIYTMVFSPNMDVGETITGINSLTCTPAGLTIGYPEPPLISGQEIQFRISGGTNKQSYKVSAIVSTSKGNTLQFDAILSVRDNI